MPIETKTHAERIADSLEYSNDDVLYHARKLNMFHWPGAEQEQHDDLQWRLRNLISHTSLQERHVQITLRRMPLGAPGVKTFIGREDNSYCIVFDPLFRVPVTAVISTALTLIEQNSFEGVDRNRYFDEQALRSFLVQRGRYREIFGTPDPAPPLFPQNPIFQNTVSMLTQVSTSFILAHELAHIELGHFELNLSSPTGPSGNASAAYSTEIEADKRAFFIVRGDLGDHISKKSYVDKWMYIDAFGTPPAQVGWSAIALFSTLALFEKIESRMPGASLLASNYPTSGIRRETMLNMVKQYSGRHSLCTNILARISNTIAPFEDK